MLTITTPPPTMDSTNEGALVMRVSGPVRTVTSATFIKVSQIHRRKASLLVGLITKLAGSLTWSVC